jgi:hypothetical protein
VGAGGGAPGSPRASSARRRRRASPRPALHGALAPRASFARLLPSFEPRPSAQRAIRRSSRQLEQRPSAPEPGPEPLDPGVRGGDPRPPEGQSSKFPGNADPRREVPVGGKSPTPGDSHGARRRRRPPCPPPRRAKARVLDPCRAAIVPERDPPVAAFSVSPVEGASSPAPGPGDVRPRGPARLSHAPQRRRRAGRHGAPRGRALTRCAPRGRRAAGGGGPRAGDRRHGTEASGRGRRADGRGEQDLRLRSPKRDHVDSTAFRTQVSDPVATRSVRVRGCWAGLKRRFPQCCK